MTGHGRERAIKAHQFAEIYRIRLAMVVGRIMCHVQVGDTEAQELAEEKEPLVTWRALLIWQQWLWEAEAEVQAFQSMLVQAERVAEYLSWLRSLCRLLAPLRRAEERGKAFHPMDAVDVEALAVQYLSEVRM